MRPEADDDSRCECMLGHDRCVSYRWHDGNHIARVGCNLIQWRSLLDAPSVGEAVTTAPRVATVPE